MLTFIKSIHSIISKKDTSLIIRMSVILVIISFIEFFGLAMISFLIINIGSMDGLHVPVVQRVPTFAYSASKAALHHLTRALAVELGPRHITVNAVAPGFFESRMTDYIFEHYLEDIEADCPLGRIGQAEEMAGIAVYLSSRAGNYTNGAVIPVDGGTNVSKGVKPWTQS